MGRRLEVHPVFDGVAYGPLIEIFAAANAHRDVRGNAVEHWQGIADPGEVLVMPLGGFLVRDGRRTVMIDAGLGGRHGTPSALTFKGGALAASLSRIGVARDEVTDVFLTHLHYDHIGWCSSGGEVMFPNATYRCHTEDWELFTGSTTPDEATRERLLPISSQLETWSGDSEPVDGFRVMHAPGHTPGSSVVRAMAETESICFLGDLVHQPVQLEQAGWASLGDRDHQKAARTREWLCELLLSTGWYAAPAHFAGMRPGQLSAGDGDRRWVPASEQNGAEIRFGDFASVEEMSRRWAEGSIAATMKGEEE